MALFSASPTPEEKADRERWTKLQETVTNGLRNFQILGAALKEIRDRQLYRFTYETFEQCCEMKWTISSRHATRLIVAFETAQEIGPAGRDDLTEHQLRPLTTLPAGQRKPAYEEALADGGTTAAIEKAVARRRPRKAKPAALKKLRLKVPGGTISIEPNRRATTHEQMLLDALSILQQRLAA